MGIVARNPMINKNINQAINLLEKEINLCDQSVQSIRFRRTQKNLVMGLLFKDILYLAKSCSSLLKVSPNIIALPPVVRSMYERFIDILLISHDGENRLKFLRSSDEEQRKLFINLKNISNQDSSFEHGIDEIDTKIKELENRINEFKIKNIHSMSFENKINKLQEIHNKDFKMLYPIYRQLSSQSHSNLIAIINKYRNDSGRDFFDFSPPPLI
jgi:prefoldin subunit 5